MATSVLYLVPRGPPPSYHDTQGICLEWVKSKTPLSPQTVSNESHHLEAHTFIVALHICVLMAQRTGFLVKERVNQCKVRTLIPTLQAAGNECRYQVLDCIV